MHRLKKCDDYRAVDLFMCENMDLITFGRAAVFKQTLMTLSAGTGAKGELTFV